jgi:hypothetical protein
VKKSGAIAPSKASKQITTYIASLTDWRGAMLATLRRTILAASSDLTEEWKWGSPVWTSNGLVCAASAFKDHVKVNFFKGASLKDPSRLFNAGLDAKTMRSVDFHQGDRVNEAVLKSMVQAAVAFNKASHSKG